MSQCPHVPRNWIDLVSPETQGNESLIAGPRAPQLKPAGWLAGSLRHTLRPQLQSRSRGGLASSARTEQDSTLSWWASPMTVHPEPGASWVRAAPAACKLACHERPSPGSRIPASSLNSQGAKDSPPASGSQSGGPQQSGHPGPSSGAQHARGSSPPKGGSGT